MYICGVILIIVAIICSYSIITWEWQCRNNRIFKIKHNLDVINLGSTYAYYDLDYGEVEGISGCNLANVPQGLDYDVIMLKKYIKYIKTNGKILIVLPDFVFVAGVTNEDRKIYYEVMLPWEMKHFSIRILMKYIWRAAKEPFTHAYRKEAMRWQGYVASYDEKVNHAERRIADWVNNIKIPNVQTDEVSDELLKRLEINKKYVLDIIEMCNNHGNEPILIVPPVSKIMRDKVSQVCLERYLKQPIREIQQLTGVRVFDYMEENEFWNVDLYLNSDCMNNEGRKKFTSRVLNDIGIV